MSAKPTTRPARALQAFAAATPWWAWVGAAVILHLLLHWAAVPDAVGPARFGDAGGLASQGFLAALASVAQYLVPALCIVGAVVCPQPRHARRVAPAGASDGAATPALETLSWREFVTLVGQAFRLQGYNVNEPGGAGADAGMDLLLRKERQTFLVYCKHWRAAKVGVETVQAAHAAMRIRGAAAGFVLACGRFNREAVQFAAGANIRLVDGPALLALIQQARASLPDCASTAPVELEPVRAAPPRLTDSVASPRVAARPPLRGAVASAEQALPCPVCGAEMRRRKAKRGLNAGQYFWGCSRHPDCKGTRRLRPD